ncbi:MAG: hypothetical protein V7L26_15850 [Nostoc sp.]|uniref:hypothetical protein n=1 Tax=Nostoc sp. TaxID=1180 RepID=UPI002FEF32D3
MGDKFLDEGLGTGNWGLGTGDWVMGTGDWVMGELLKKSLPNPNPQSPIPNP